MSHGLPDEISFWIWYHVGKESFPKLAIPHIFVRQLIFSGQTKSPETYRVTVIVILLCRCFEMHERAFFSSSVIIYCRAIADAFVAFPYRLDTRSQISQRCKGHQIVRKCLVHRPCEQLHEDMSCLSIVWCIGRVNNFVRAWADMRVFCKWDQDTNKLFIHSTIFKCTPTVKVMPAPLIQKSHLQSLTLSTRFGIFDCIIDFSYIANLWLTAIFPFPILRWQFDSRVFAFWSKIWLQAEVKRILYAAGKPLKTFAVFEDRIWLWRGLACVHVTS